MPKSNLTWTPSETLLLLDVASEYKVNKMLNGIDWETCRSRYDEILKDFIEKYKEHTCDGNNHTQDFPMHSNLEFFTKNVIIGKIKRLKKDYKTAVDTGRKSGGGRVIYQYFEQCEKLWEGSPSVETLPEGVSSGNAVEPDNYINQTVHSVASSSSSDIINASNIEESSIELNTSQEVPNIPDEQENSSAPTAFPKDRRSRRLNRRLAKHDMLELSIKEEREYKKQCLRIMDESNAKIDKFTMEMREGVESINRTMAEGFGVLREFLFSEAPTNSENFLYFGRLSIQHISMDIIKKHLFN